MTDSNDDIFREELPSLSSALRNGARRLCLPSTIAKKFPPLVWLPGYKLPSYLLQDFIAGFTVGLTTIPQAIAYGVVAGLEPQYGLYSSFMGSFVYILFGSCKDVTIATTAIMALMVHQYAEISPEYAVLITFLAGCIILALGLLNLGVLVRFISMPVITGFMMAAAITIGSAQINNLFGIRSSSNQMIYSWKYFFTHLSSTRLYDAVLGVSTLMLLLLLKNAKAIPYGNKHVWNYIGLGRNALAVIVGTLLAYELSRDGSQPFSITGNITAGLPPFRPPPFNVDVNGTLVPFTDAIQTVGTSLATIPLVAILEIVAISKAFSKGKIVDASQEMVALGMCNIMGSFVSAMPVTGSFTRTAVNNASGVKTQLGGAVTGGLVLLSLAFLTQTFYYIPKTTLAAIIIAAMISLVDLNEVTDIWKSKKLDVLPFLVTILTCLFWNLEYGILCGILVNVSFILYSSARPPLVLTKDKVNDHVVGIVDVKQQLDFASAEYIKEKIVQFVSESGATIGLIVLQGTHINSIDYTVASNIISLREDLHVLKCDLICWNWSMAAAGVVCRLSNGMIDTFKFDLTVEDAVGAYYSDEHNAGSSNTLGSKSGNPPIQRNAANARERARMRVLSSAFGRLKTKLPNIPPDTKLSKLDTLRLATMYIKQLKVLVETGAAIGENSDCALEDERGMLFSMQRSGSQSMTWPFGFHQIQNASRQSSVPHISMDWSPSQEAIYGKLQYVNNSDAYSQQSCPFTPTHWYKEDCHLKNGSDCMFDDLNQAHPSQQRFQHHPEHYPQPHH